MAIVSLLQGNLMRLYLSGGVRSPGELLRNLRDL